MKIILFCPVREKPEVLKLSLEAHRKLEGISERWYFDDNEPFTESVKILRTAPGIRWWSVPSPGDYSPYEEHRWTSTLMSRMASIRDQAISQITNEPDADALFILDSDVIPHPKTVEHLASLNLPVVSTIYWSQWNQQVIETQPDGSTKEYTRRSPWLPNVWDFHNYQFHGVESILRLKQPGTYPVGGLGACTLIRRDAIEKGARYEPVPGIRDYPGEDRHFSIRCAVNGIPLHVDTHYPAFHIYRPEEQLKTARLWMNGETNGELIDCDPEYFADEWLTSEWEQQIRSMETA
jgi:hypothetical protein